MTRSLRSLVGLSSVVLVSLLGLTGCATECHKDEATGKQVCTAETLTQYEGAAVQKSYDQWTAGQTIRINVKGGNVRSGFAATAITVSGGGAAGTVGVNFRPFESNTKEKADAAKKELTENLVLDVSESNGEVVVSVSQTGTHQSSLSARVDLTLPAGFAGAIVASSESGDVSIDGANGSVDVSTSNADVDITGAIHGLKVQTDNGDVAVELSEPAASDDSGSISTDRDIALFVPAASDISLSAQAGELVSFVPDPLPAGWADTVESDNNKAITGNKGSTSTWTLNNTDFAFSHITVTVQLDVPLARSGASEIEASGGASHWCRHERCDG